MRKKSSDSMRRLAETLGVAQSTVSRALAGNRGVSEETRSRIVAAARQAGVARRRCRTVTVVLPVSSLGVIGPSSYLITELMHEAERRNLLAEFVPLDHLEILNEKTTLGVISLDFQFRLSKVFGRNWNLPLVCVNDYSSPLEQAYAVCSDERKIMMNVVDYLAGFGHRRIGLLGQGGFETFIGELRRDTFRERVECHSGTAFVEPVNYLTPNGIRPPGDLPLRHLLDREITALVCCGEGCWRQVQPALRRAGSRWPEDLSIVAWLTPELQETIAPPLTSVCQPYRELAREAFELLEKQTAGNVLLDYHFREGDSVGVPAR